MNLYNKFVQIIDILKYDIWKYLVDVFGTRNYDRNLLFCSKYLRNKLRQSYIPYCIYDYSDVLDPINQLNQINAMKKVKRIKYDYKTYPVHSLHEFSSMTQLVLGHEFNQPLDKKMLPDSLIC